MFSITTILCTYISLVVIRKIIKHICRVTNKTVYDILDTIIIFFGIHAVIWISVLLYYYIVGDTINLGILLKSP